MGFSVGMELPKVCEKASMEAEFAKWRLSESHSRVMVISVKKKIGELLRNIFASSLHLRFNLRLAGYKEDTAASIGGLIMGGIAVCSGLFVGLFVWFS